MNLPERVPFLPGHIYNDPYVGFAQPEKGLPQDAAVRRQEPHDGRYAQLTKNGRTA